MSTLIACPATVRTSLSLNINSLQGFSRKLYWRVVKNTVSIKILRVEFKYFLSLPSPPTTLDLSFEFLSRNSIFQMILTVPDSGTRQALNEIPTFGF